MHKVESIRCGNTIWDRKWFDSTDENKESHWGPWQPRRFPSISQAKKANGLNSRTVESPKLLPDWQAQQAA